MTRVGHVSKAMNGMIEVTFCGGEECEQCGACDGGKKQMTLWLKSEAEVGDTAVVDLPEKTVVRASFLAYVMPIILMILGILAGKWIAPEQELVGAGLAFAGLGIALLILFLTEKKRRADPAWQPKLLEVIHAETKEEDKNGNRSEQE